MKGVVLSGGTGSRLRPITHTGPKQLIPIANTPVIQYAIEDLAKVGITDIGVVLGNQGSDAVREFLGDGSAFGVEITYIVQGDPLGIAHAVGCTEAFVDGDDFVVYLGDNMLKESLGPFVEHFRAGDYAGGAALQRVDNPEAFGVATLDERGDLVRIVEKPEVPESDVVIIGIYIFSAAVFDAIDRIEPSDRGELEITDVFQALVDDGRAIATHRVEGWWKDTGMPSDILEANRLVLEDLSPDRAGSIADGAEVIGRIDLHETARIEEGATVRGPVSIAKDVVVGPGSYVGPFTSLGPETTLRNAHVENSVVIGASTITAEGPFVDCLLGRGTTIERDEGARPKGHRLVVGENSRLVF